MFTEKPICDCTYSNFFHNYPKKKQHKGFMFRASKKTNWNLYSLEYCSAIIKMKWITHTVSNMSESDMHTEGEVTGCVPCTWCSWCPSRAYRLLRTKWYVVTVAQLCSSSRQDHYIGSFLLLLLTSTHLWLPENRTGQYVYTNSSQTVRKMKLTPPLAQLHRYQTSWDFVRERGRSHKWLTR